MRGFVPHNAPQLRQMLRAIGIPSLRALLPTLPGGEPVEHKVEGIPKPLSEWEIEQTLEERFFLEPLPKTVLLGAGAYCHAIPAAVEALAQRGEFLTSYTPYQAEASQGTLTALFEFQTFIARLFGMEIANSSMYDGASSLAEAVLMAFRVTKRHKALIKATLHPEYRETLKTYVAPLGFKLKTLPITPKGASDLASLDAELDDGDPVGAVVVDYPSFLGTLEDLGPLVERAHKKGALVVSVTYEPTALGLIKAPGDFGVDIAVGEGQALGNPVAFGGATLGLFATKASLVRQMPGRLVGETRDAKGRRVFLRHVSHEGTAHPKGKIHFEHLHQPRPFCPPNEHIPGTSWGIRNPETGQAKLSTRSLPSRTHLRGNPERDAFVRRSVLQRICSGHPRLDRRTIPGAP